jgi:hypothetical protein
MALLRRKTLKTLLQKDCSFRCRQFRIVLLTELGTRTLPSSEHELSQVRETD